MLAHIWSVLCRQSIIDTETNNVSMLNVLEQLDVNVAVKNGNTSPVQINVPIDYEVVSMWYREDRNIEEAVELKLSIYNPKGVEAFCINQNVVAPRGAGRLRTRTKVSGLVVTESGRYLFRLSFKHGEGMQVPVAEIPLEVTVKKSKNSNVLESSK